jgi:hypothetical protein
MWSIDRLVKSGASKCLSTATNLSMLSRPASAGIDGDSLRGYTGFEKRHPAVAGYEISHPRRSDLTHGATGLCKVFGRRNSSHESYMSPDVTYIENQSLSLDVRIASPIVGVVLAVSGS